MSTQIRKQAITKPRWIKIKMMLNSKNTISTEYKKWGEPVQFNSGRCSYTKMYLSPTQQHTRLLFLTFQPPKQDLLCIITRVAEIMNKVKATLSGAQLECEFKQWKSPPLKLLGIFKALHLWGQAVYVPLTSMEFRSSTAWNKCRWL